MTSGSTSRSRTSSSRIERGMAARSRDVRSSPVPASAMRDVRAEARASSDGFEAPGRGCGRQRGDRRGRPSPGLGPRDTSARRSDRGHARSSRAASSDRACGSPPSGSARSWSCLASCPDRASWRGTTRGSASSSRGRLPSSDPRGGNPVLQGREGAPFELCSYERRKKEGSALDQRTSVASRAVVGLRGQRMAPLSQCVDSHVLRGACHAFAGRATAFPRGRPSPSPPDPGSRSPASVARRQRAWTAPRLAAS